MRIEIFYCLQRRSDKQIFYGDIGRTSKRYFVIYQDDSLAVWNDEWQCDVPARIRKQYKDLVSLSKEWRILSQEEAMIV